MNIDTEPGAVHAIQKLEDSGQKRQQWELDAGKTPLFCDKYAMQRARKILGKNMHRVKTAILIHRASNEIALKWIYNKGYLKSEEIVELRFYRQGQYSLTFISKII